VIYTAGIMTAALAAEARAHVHAALATALLLPSLFAQEARVPKPMPSLEEMKSLRVVFTLPRMDQAVVRRDLVYKTVGETRLEADVYAPPELGAGARRPAVIFIHGGPIPPAMKPKGMGVFVSYGELAAASGFIGVTFNHRFHGGAQLQDAADDVADLVAWVRGKAGELRVDADRIALWAFSGGGPFLSPYLAEPVPYARALVAYYAVLDLRPVPPGQPDTLGRELRQRYSPAYLVSRAAKPLPPMLVARAGEDNPVLNQGLDLFVHEALAHNARLDLLNHAEGRHGFDILDDDARSREIVGRTLEFLKARLE